MAKSKPEPDRTRTGQDIILVYKADRSVSADFKEWLEGLGAHVGAPVTITLDMALKSYAASVGYTPMPKRLAR